MIVEHTGYDAVVLEFPRGKLFCFVLFKCSSDLRTYGQNSEVSVYATTLHPTLAAF